MKKLTIFLKNILFLIILSLIFFASNAQNFPKLKSTQDVISWYKGWKGNPDTLSVHIDSTFTKKEKDSINMAIKTWNDAGCKPALKTTNKSSDAQISITEKNIDDEGLCSYEPTDAAKKNEKATITIDSDRGISLKEVATHELGHALGLADTKGAGTGKDVMKAKGTNGTDGALSKHDSTELKLAIAKLEANKNKSKKTIKEASKKMAFMPGESGIIVFPLVDLSPELLENSNISVNIIADTFIHLDTFEVAENELIALISVHPEHWDGMYMLNININTPDDEETLQYFGIHYVSHNPVPETEFECPFEVFQEEETVHIAWEGMTTYPYDLELRAVLMVEGVGVFHQKGGGNFTLNLSPGEYYFTLVVDDYQGNKAFFNQTVNVTQTGLRKVQKKAFLFEIYPNPFKKQCRIVTDKNSKVAIYSTHGKKVASFSGGNSIWQPNDDIKSGIYIIKSEKDGIVVTKKIQFVK